MLGRNIRNEERRPNSEPAHITAGQEVVG
jgi:hypothetical protein